MPPPSPSPTPAAAPPSASEPAVGGVGRGVAAGGAQGAGGNAEGRVVGTSYRATVASLAVGQVLNWAVLYYTFSALLLPMQRDLGWSQATLMGAYTLGLGVCGAATYAMGAAIDAGRGRAVMAGGCVLAALGVLAWSFMTAPWMFYAVWVVLGLASAACLYEPAFAVLTQRYPTRYREGITTLTLLGGFASTLCFPALTALQQGLGLDWREVLRVLAVVMLLMVPLHLWALRGPMLVAHPQAQEAAPDATLGQAMAQRNFWLLTVCFTAFAVIQITLWAHVMPLFESKAVDAADTVLVLMVIGPAQVAGRLVFAAVGKGRSLRLLGFGVLFGLAAAMIILAMGHSLPVLLLFAVVFGLANGLVTIVRGGLVPEYFGRAQVGRISGVMSGIGQIARALAPLGASLLLVVVGGYAGLEWAMVGLALLSLLTYWRAGAPPRRVGLAHRVAPVDPPGSAKAAAD